MISDVLADAIVQMDEYLNDPAYRDTYSGNTRKELEALRTLMDGARARLDAPPLNPGTKPCREEL